MISFHERKDVAELEAIEVEVRDADATLKKILGKIRI